MGIEVTRIYALILIPIILLFMYLTLKKLKGLVRKDKLILISRITILMLIVIGISDITINLKGENISTVFLLDVSDSMSGFKAEGVKFIDNALKEMPKNNKAGVIVFGDNASVDKFMDTSKEYKQIKSAPIINSTNIEEAVNSSLGLFEKGAAKRIVLITDGEENQGDILKTVPLIKKENIDLKVYKVDNALGDEAYVEDVKVPDNISIGEEFSVITKIESNVQTKAKLTLFSGRDKKGEQQVELQKGSNTFAFKDVQTSGGFKSYRVVIDPEKDSNKSNNEYSCFTNVVSKPNILVLEGKTGDSAGIVETLRAANSEYNVRLATGAPSTLNELLAYKTIVLANVHADDLNKGFMDNIESYVKDYGGGVVTFGGDNSYALGGYKDTALEKILPVNMDKKGKNEVPQISISLVIDKSGSMSDGGSVSKLTLAKEAAMNSLNNLRDTDEINVIAFDDSYQEVVERQKVQDKEKIKGMIAGISGGGGTSIYPALEEAYKSQVESKAKIKHIILLTDGQDSFGVSNYQELIGKMNDAGITLSTVSVGEDADGQLLGKLAEMGKGRTYHSDKYTDIPRIFAKEVLLSSGTYIINEEFTPKVSSNHEILNGVLVDNSLPTLLGYVGTSMKDKAIEILSSSHDEPILAANQYGLGKTVSWTSDINGEWSKNFLTWNKGAQLIKNAIYWTIPDLNDAGKLSITQSGNEAVVEFYSDSVKDGSKIKGVYNNEKGNSGELELTQEEPGKFVGRVKLDELGFYTFNIREENNGQVLNNYNGAFSFEYSDEYKFNKNSGKIDTLIEEVKGSFINKPKDVFKGELKSAYKAMNLTEPTLIAAILLFLLEVAYRRLNLDFSKYLIRFMNIFAGKVFRKNIEFLIKKKEIRNRDTKQSNTENYTEEEKGNFTDKLKSAKSEEKATILKSHKNKNKPQALDTSALLKSKKKRED
ncbi:MULTISPECIES: VWA domain-containing protein [unclassified Clostridium]|uniref:VWA domain-containing protein n=1 Tax=unclassified Clostridium TaxID=2614128 RepID=UPI000297CD59|nr:MULTISPECIES: VWA domain-containing protein [unclassified Clostridium]EKQ51406.1 MAG: putative membrane protein [Clostridium sp. Maddingley MBC34-26]